MAKKSGTSERKRLSADDLAKQQREISVSEFFSKNRHLLGFDNPKRALLTTVKEAVDNALDACEDAGVLPDIVVKIESVGKRDDRYKVIVEDNGPGIAKEQVAKIFGKLLYGSKFHRLKMSRGQQGIGISAAGMYGQMTTGKPVEILSKTRAEGPANFFRVVLDTKKNEPKIAKEDTVQWNGHAGTSVQIELEGTYQRGKWSPEEYIRHTVIANPHVSLTFIEPDGKEHHFERAVEVLPDEPEAIKPHPHGIELGTLIQMLQQTKCRKLQTCLREDFCRVSKRRALEICEKADVYENARPKRIARQEAESLLAAIRDTDLMNPPMNCIAPIGEEQILAGMQNQVEADFYETVTRKPSVYRGIPFLIEAGIAYGGELRKDKAAKIMRFANRVPLLYRAGSGAIREAVCGLNWRQYKIDQPSGSGPVGPMLVMVHMASPWVPFTSESKEAVATYPEIVKEITLALQEAARKLRRFVNKRHKKREEKRKRKYIENYIPHIGEALQEILEFSDKEKDNLIDSLTGILKRSRKG
ncbi:MAG: DNA topoisomerase VI subunit B [Candidatus Brocadiia bacterium]